jgi:transposase
MILDLARQGLTVSAIAHCTGHDRKTIRTYIARGLEPPAYKPREPTPSPLAPFEAFLRERVGRFPDLTGRRLWREVRDLGFVGGYSTVTDFLRTIRPPAAPAFERRFETPPGRQAQVDFAHFKVRFEDEPGAERIVWLFSLVLGHSRMMWARFVAQQDLATVLRCHVAAFEALGGVPEQILYDRMRTAVLGEVDERGIVYNDKLLALAGHYGYLPKACRAYRAKTKGKVERPFRYVREDFFLARSFRNLGDLNAQFTQWLDQVANRRLHGTTGRIVIEHFAEERPALKPLPAGPFNAVLRLERRISHEGMISPLLRPRRHPPASGRGAGHRRRGPDHGGRPAHRRPPRARGSRPAPHRRGPSQPAATAQ